MVNLDSTVAQILSTIGKALPEFSADESFPLITYIESDNVCNQVMDGVESVSDITYLIEIWDNCGSRAALEILGGQVSSAMVQNRFWRISSKTTAEPDGFYKKAMHFKTTVVNT